MKYFKNITSIESLKKAYKKLALKFHPDITKDDGQAMKDINNEYDALFAKYKNIHDSQDGTTYTKETQEQSNEFRDIINSIISFNIDIEVIGSWVWCFNCFEYKDQLKALGFKWASKKKAWVWHSPNEEGRRSKMTLSEIRYKYGSEMLKNREPVPMIG